MFIVSISRAVTSKQLSAQKLTFVKRLYVKTQINSVFKMTNTEILQGSDKLFTVWYGECVAFDEKCDWLTLHCL